MHGLNRRLRLIKVRKAMQQLDAIARRRHICVSPTFGGWTVFEPTAHGTQVGATTLVCPKRLDRIMRAVLAVSTWLGGRFVSGCLNE